MRSCDVSMNLILVYECHFGIMNLVILQNLCSHFTGTLDQWLQHENELKTPFHIILILSWVETRLDLD